MFVAYLLSMILFDGAGIKDCSTANNLTMQCNLAGYIDRAVLTREHMFKGDGGFTDP
jgi:hypothetical protein